jgi:hypothetical protein
MPSLDLSPDAVLAAMAPALTGFLQTFSLFDIAYDVRYPNICRQRCQMKNVRGCGPDRKLNDVA